jgi:UDP-N-acetylmuramoyl-tripeptide--D-alanyl-D-alanine ligase
MSIAVAELYVRFLESKGVSTDTRNIRPGSMFFALKGERFNANTFAGEAREKGAQWVVIDEQEFAVDDHCLVVDDVLDTLQQLARHHRRQLNIPVLALTGSNGKTTTKELLHAVLSKKYRTHATKGNLNNHIGVPLTLLAIEEMTEIAVVEMGANHPGEIALLCSITEPTHGLVTNIGRAHIGTFGGFDNIVRAKSELYDFLRASGGTAFVNTLHTLLIDKSDGIGRRVLYPTRADDYYAELLAADPFVRIRAEDGSEVQTRLVGSYNFENIACALCVGKFFGVPAQHANQAVADYVPGNMRSQAVTTARNTIILDAYNANPSSMQVAIENLASMDTPDKILILGDMYELEDEAEAEHRAVGKSIRELGFSNVYLCGELFKAALHEIPYAKYFPRKEDLVRELEQYPVSDATILIKASRGMGLETIVEYL